MFCPGCGGQQSNEKKFCPACGTNLAVVTAALQGQLAPTTIPHALAEAQQRARQEMAAAIYKGAPGLGMLLGALLVFVSLPSKAAVFICFGLIIAGISALGKGISHYYLASTELRAAEQEVQHRLPFASSITNPLPSAPDTAAPHYPPSVTEHTTRHLG